MGTAAAGNRARITTVHVVDQRIVAELDDGRAVSVPLEWSWRLARATPQQRGNYRLLGSGQGIHWPDVDEDISLESMLAGRQSRPEPGER